MTQHQRAKDELLNPALEPKLENIQDITTDSLVALRIHHTTDELFSYRRIEEGFA